ncbi:MAG: VWA domain-containing protein [Planctomycetota bacterium]
MIDLLRSLFFPFAPSPFLWVALLFLIALPVLVYRYFRKQATRRLSGTLQYSSLQNFRAIPPSVRAQLRQLPFFLRMMALLCLIIALARPQRGKEGTEVNTEGISILIALDRSSSMMARDFKLHGKLVDRLDAVKEVTQKFIARRYSDEIGLVVFSGYADLQCPLTLDYNILNNLVSEVTLVEPGSSEDGTAIGDAIGLSVLRLKDVDSKSKVLILLTDGENTAGELTPLKGAELAQKHHIKIFTIGAGTQGLAQFPVQDIFGKRYVSVPVKIDEKTLKEIADKTQGKYFRATDTQSLEEIYELIDEMTKTPHKRNIFTEYIEIFHYFVWGALLFLFLEILLANTWFRKLP